MGNNGKRFSDEQLAFAEKAHEAIIDCWHIDGTDEDEVAKAVRAEAECKADYAEVAAEDGIFDSFEDFLEAVDYVSAGDHRSMAYC